METKIGRLAAIAVVAGTVGAGTLVGVAPAQAASAPTLHVTLYDGPEQWTGWQSHVDTMGNTGCRQQVVHPPAAVLSPNAPIFTGRFGWPQHVLPEGVYTLTVACDGAKSNSVSFYSPRSPVNDARTVFSDATQGTFGS